jgi:hypothetical protein
MGATPIKDLGRFEATNVHIRFRSTVSFISTPVVLIIIEQKLFTQVRGWDVREKLTT